MELRNLKQHLIEEVMKVNDEHTLKNLEQVLKKRSRTPPKIKIIGLCRHLERIRSSRNETHHL